MKRSIILLFLPILFLMACSNEPKKEEAPAAPTPSAADTKEAREEKNKQVAMASVNAMVAGDVDGMLKDAAPDITDYGDGEFRPIKGMDSLKVMLHGWLNAVGDYKGENLMPVADGDYVAVIGEWSGKFKTDFMGMKVKGKSFKIKDVDIFKFNNDGKITEHRNIQSSGTMMKQLGVK